VVDRLRKSVCPQLKITPVVGQQWNLLGDSKSLSKWFKYRMTTFEYLMKLNKIGGRSYKDLTQYPVVPWILNDGEMGRYRDLTKPMGALGSSERQEVFD
jgi:hypothetical protein